MRFYRIKADVSGSETAADRRRRQEQGCVFQAKTEAAYSASADMVMPLDTYTLNWFYRTKNEKHPEKETWSNMDDKRYYSIADKINSYVKTKFPGLSPLESEFMIWPIEKSIVSLKELKSAISKSCSDQIITAHLGKERIKALQEIGKAEALTFENAYGYAKHEE